MQAAPIVFALVLGWVTGNEHLPPSLVNWLTARETIGVRSLSSASCSVEGNQFVLRQVLIDEKSVSSTEP